MKKTNAEKRVVIYCRESRDEYGENYERIETQRDLLLNFCKNNGYTNIIDIVMDDDKSGTDFSRFNNIRNRIKNNEIDVIVFKNSARLGRNQKEALDFVEYLEEKGVEIIFEDEQYNEEMFGLYAWFNERRARDDSKNIRRNLKHKIEEGKLIVRPIYGYDKVGNRLVINAETSKVVKQIFELYTKGKSYNDIACYLNKNYIKTPSKSKGYINTKKSNVWNSQNIIRILNDRRYIGDYVGGYTEKVSFKSKKIRIKNKNDWTIIPNNHEPIIDKDIFYKAQEMSRKNKKCIEKRKSNNNDIFLKYIYCGKCNSKMYLKKSKKDELDSYICKKYSTEGRENGLNNGCKSHRIRKSYIEIAIKKYINNLLINKQFINYAIENINIENTHKKEVKTILAERIFNLEKLKEMYAQIYDDKLNGIIPTYLFLEKKKELENKIEQENQKIEEMKLELEKIEEVKNKENVVLNEINNIIEKGLTEEEFSKVFDRIIVFEKKEITNKEKGLYRLNDKKYNMLYKYGGLIVILRNELKEV